MVHSMVWCGRHGGSSEIARMLCLTGNILLEIAGLDTILDHKHQKISNAIECNRPETDVTFLRLILNFMLGDVFMLSNVAILHCISQNNLVQVNHMWLLHLQLMCCQTCGRVGVRPFYN